MSLRGRAGAEIAGENWRGGNRVAVAPPTRPNAYLSCDYVARKSSLDYCYSGFPSFGRSLLMPKLIAVVNTRTIEMV
jgi:hypothetical protein